MIEIDVPGVERGDITIEVVDIGLTISGEFRAREEEAPEKTGRLRHRARRVGRFNYRVALPRKVNAEQITAELTDGVLTVTVPKAETAEPRRIEITVR